MSEPTVIRKDDNTIEVTKDGWDGTKVVPNVIEYKLDFLLSQRNSITEQKEREMAQRDLELAEVEVLIGYFETVQVTEPVIEPEEVL